MSGIPTPRPSRLAAPGSIARTTSTMSRFELVEFSMTGLSIFFPVLTAKSPTNLKEKTKFFEADEELKY